MEMLIAHLLIRGKIALVIKVEQTRATLPGISKGNTCIYQVFCTLNTGIHCAI